LFDEDYDLRLWEKSLTHAIDAKNLEHYQTTMGIGKPNSEKWTTALNANRCKYARIFIPVQWTGDADDSCKKNPKGNEPGPSKFRNVRVT